MFGVDAGSITVVAGEIAITAASPNDRVKIKEKAGIYIRGPIPHVNFSLSYQVLI